MTRISRIVVCEFFETDQHRLLVLKPGANYSRVLRKAKNRHAVKRDGSLQGAAVCIDLSAVNNPCHCFFIKTINYRHRK
jgi:hypothetical protein